MRHFFLMMLLLLVGCSRYPDGEATLQKLSYRGGDIHTWQNEFRQTLLTALELPASALTTSPTPEQLRYTIQTIDLSKPDYKKLRSLLTDFTTLSDAQELCLQNPQRVFTIQNVSTSKPNAGLQLRTCDDLLSGTTSVVLFDVRLQAYDGYPLQAYLLWPAHAVDGDGQSSPDVEQHLPTFVYWHGHGSDRQAAALDFASYHKAIGLQLAQKGFLTLIPDIRTFERGNKAHYKMMKKMGQTHPPIFATWLQDAYLWGQWLRLADLRPLGMTTSSLNRDNAQIAGTSLGSQIALWVGALDSHYQAVTSVGGFYGFEVLFSKHHHDCQHVPKLLGLGNIMDVALLVWPRHLHIGMGLKDKFYNGFSSSAWTVLQSQLAKFGGTACEGSPEDMPEKLLTPEGCQMSFERDEDASHELTTTLQTFQIFAGQKP